MGKSDSTFRLLADKSESVSEYFKAILGLTNSYFSIRKNSEIKRLLPELEELLDVVPLDQDLSFRLLKANVFYSIDNNLPKAKRIFQEVIRKSLPHRWNYFVIKSLLAYPRCIRSLVALKLSKQLSIF